MRIYNSLTRTKENFSPIKEGEAGIYVCGPTVYNFFHIGNARVFIIFDVLRRYLEYSGYKVKYVQNFTDVDDKMIRAAALQEISVKELGDKFIEEYNRDAEALGIRKPDIAPRATEHISEMIALVQTLIDKGHAYTVGSAVYFDVASYPQYGALVTQSLDDLMAGARVEVDEGKRSPLDFALWKERREGEPYWPTPWGEGRPGWHLECSAMSMKYLGETFDIHAGGQDLSFPHHENEIAQSEAATGKQFARYWMHNGFISVNNLKMSKSLGNFFTVRDILAEFDASAVRLFMLGAQYRNPINFSREQIEQASAAYERLNTAYGTYGFVAESGAAEPAGEEFEARAGLALKEFAEAMDDDLNTADALGVIFEFVREANTAATSSAEAAKLALKTLDTMLDVLGLKMSREEAPAEILELAERRQAARAARDFAEADRLRGELKDKGYAVEDTPQGPKVKKL